MLELVRIETGRGRTGGPMAGAESGSDADPDPAANTLAVGLARTAQELEAIQRLRYQVFTEDMGAVFPGSPEGIDQDRFDPWCEHLMVRELNTDRIVGTYRLLTPEKARAAGGYYAETEFDLRGLGALRDGLVEAGRSCTHADFRSGAVIMLLWSGVAEFMRRGGYDTLLGCASVSLRDGGAMAAHLWRAVSASASQEALARVRPLRRYAIDAEPDETLPVRMPALIKGYLKLGARICGEPAWDPDFNSADFPVLLHMDQMDRRYRRHFGLPPGPDTAASGASASGAGASRADASRRQRRAA